MTSEKEEEVNVDNKENDDERDAEKPKPKLSERLNVNLSKKTKVKVAKYITIEPILIGFLILYLKFKLEGPYSILKKCTELKDDDFLCEEVATLDIQRMENYKNWTVIVRNHSETFVDRVWNDPEFHQVYGAHDIVVTKLESQSDFSQYINICAQLIQLLILMSVSSSSDKNNKRKMCLLIPLFGQFLASIVNIIGIIMTNSMSYELNQLLVTMIEVITGGKDLLVFGCLCYLGDEFNKRKTIFVKLGAYALITTILRHTPLYTHIRDSSTTKGAYAWSVILYMLCVIFCLVFVKVALSESKDPNTINTETDEQVLDESSALKLDSVDDIGSVKSIKEKPSKMEIVAKAFLLDVVYNTALLVAKYRKDGRRWAILLLLAISILVNFMPFRHYSVSFGDSFLMDNYDCDGAVLVIVSILMVLGITNDTIVAVMAIVAPIASKLVIVSLGLLDESLLSVQKTKYGIYDIFFYLQSFAVLFLIVGKNEISIFSSFVAASFIVNLLKTFIPNPGRDLIPFIILAYVLLLVMAICLCFFVFLMKKIVKANAENRRKKLSINLKVLTAVNKMKMALKLPPTSSTSEMEMGNESERKSAHHPANVNNVEESSTETNSSRPANGSKLWGKVKSYK